MTNKLAAAEVDKRIWAAYVAGHHAQILRFLQEVRWTIARVPVGATRDRVVEAVYRDRAMDGVGFGVALAELRRALRVLAVADQVLASVLVELHRAIDQLASAFRDSPKSRQFSPPEATSPPGLEDWREVVTLTGHLIKSSSDLHTWTQLGSLLGKCQLLLRVHPEIDHDGLAQEMSELADLLADLCASQQYSFLEEVKRLADSIAPGDKKRPSSPGLGHTNLYLDFARVDQQVQYALQEQPAPEPLLILSREKLILFGEALELAGCSEDQIGVLWLLAERAGMPVPRKTILEEVKITVDSKVNTLKSIVSRLRKKILRPLIKRYRRRQGGPPLRGEEMAFIIGRDKKLRKTYQWGNYQLQLDPALVRVIGPRPKWMAQA